MKYNKKFCLSIFISLNILYMPYSIRKVAKKPCYRVYNKNNKKVFAKCATKKNAMKQLRLLRALQYNKDFVPLAQQRAKNRTRKLRK